MKETAHVLLHFNVGHQPRGCEKWAGTIRLEPPLSPETLAEPFKPEGRGRWDGVIQWLVIAGLPVGVGVWAFFAWITRTEAPFFSRT